MSKPTEHCRPMIHRWLPFVLAVLCTAPIFAANYEIQVVDAATGRGVPLVSLTPQNGTTVVTDSNGIAAFNQAGLMNQNVAFNFSSYGYTGFATALQTTTGGNVLLPISRTNIAERLYRL